MRHYRLVPLGVWVLLLFAALGVGHGQTLLSLGASSGSGSGCSLGGGGTCTLSARVTGISPATVTFEFNPPASVTGGSVGAPVGPNATGLTTITYTGPNPVLARQTITVTATAVDGTKATSQITLVPPTVTVQVLPTSVTLTAGATQQFTASVLGISQTGVTWSISPQVGAIDTDGRYTAPATISAAQTITVTATSTFDPAVNGTAKVQLSVPTPVILVGGGAPTDAITAAFQAAWNRNAFNSFVVMPPLGNVKAFGSTGYVQEFTDAANTSSKDALITGAASLGGTNAVFQIMSPLYAYYSSVGAATAGYPLGDSQPCTGQGVSCLWDTFDKNYALFAYVTSLANGQNFSINGAYFTEWSALGGFPILGAPVTAPATITAAPVAPATSGTTAAVQSFAKGAIYSITSGTNRNKIFGVTQPMYDLYTTEQGPSGRLGLPVSEAFQIAAGTFKQNFEGGALQYSAGGDPTVVLPVTAVRLSGAQPGSTLTVNLGQSVTLTATPVVSSGTDATDRPVSWTSTNGKVISIQPSGVTAVITAVGSGAASVQAASGGVSSGRINFVVISPCCQVGDGAPLAVQQAFRDALTRNKIVAQAPLPSPAARVGSGYVQMVQSSDSSAVYMLAQSDRLGTAYVVAGAILARYQALGGPGGPLGYPASDASAGGTQLFANGAALGGNPVRLVTSPILAKWALLGYEGGAAGLPLAEATSFTTPGANSGQQQSFSKGVIYGATAGPRASQAYFVSGAILARYNALGGAAGDFGMPTSDEFSNGGVRQQNFEGGNFTYTGDSVAVEHAAPRVPGVIASPSSVPAGGRARVALVGFPNNSTIRVSVTGSPDFAVTAANGSYSWDMAIPLTAKSGTITVHAADDKGSAADGSVAVKGFAENRIPIAKLQGDNQNGLPGAMLALPLRVALADASNVPVVGAPVTFTGSVGVQLLAASTVSDAAGRAEVWVRLPSVAGVAAVTVNAPSIAQAPVTFYLLAAGSSLSNVTNFVEAGDVPLGNGSATIAQKGALLSAVASILRYHQDRGDLRAPNGPASPAALNEFLKQYCTVDVNGKQVCDGFLSAGEGMEQIVNPWRAAEFTGGVDVEAQNPTLSAIVDVLQQGSPALLSLALFRNGAPAGGHFVVATGVAADGSVLIEDPSVYLARTSLSDYLRGFNIGGVAWTVELRGVVRFALGNPPPSRFLVGALSQSPELMKGLSIDIQSAAGTCGVLFELLDAVSGSGTPSAGMVSRFQACDGMAAVYQVSVGGPQPFHAFLADLATAGSTIDLSNTAAATFQLTRSRLNVVLTPQATNFAADGVVNGATFTPGIAPGGVVSIFGTGLAGAGAATSVDFDGTPATVLLASPFQVNAVAPADLSPGPHVLSVRSTFGSSRQTVTLSAVAPAIFMVGTPPAGAVVNPDNSLNGPSAPVARGQYLVIYGTGLGVVTRQGNISSTTTPVTVVLNGTELPALYSGLTPGYSGLYQVNVTIPPGIPPGLGYSLTLKEAEQLSNVVSVAIQ